MDIGERIQRIDTHRHLQGLTIQQLADMCRLSPSTVSRTISGKTEPTEYTVRAMEDALGITEAPASDPVTDSLPDDPIVERYIRLQDARVARLRAFYNRELAEKDRWIHFLFLLCLFLAALSFALCIMVESPL